MSATSAGAPIRINAQSLRDKASAKRPSASVTRQAARSQNGSTAPVIAVHSQKAMTATSTTSNVKMTPPRTIAAKAKGASTTAEIMRVLSSLDDGEMAWCSEANNAPVAPLARGELAQCRLELLIPEVGPEHRQKDQLGIRPLPEQEIADPLLTRGAQN